ncbi:tetratricopeptide repeat protein [uncultured Sphingomonas sp.]|uniref:tetratricopeptide repeat protein n=1 Tax=uncultured Sphingomonas sp. TaxID=158754 RepID=UPI0035CC6CBE
MAVPPATDQEFLREVDDELRRDKLTGVWSRHGRWIVIGVLAALALLGAYLFWRNQQENAAGREGEQLQSAYDALGAGSTAEAAGPLEALTKSSSEGNRALALFTQADVLLQRNDYKGAAAKFGAIVGDDGVAPPFRDLALVRQTSAEYDTLAPQVVIDRLRPLAVPGNAYFGSAGEMVATAYLRTGRRDLAGRMFGQIARDGTVPATIRQRAVQMAGLLGVDAVVQNEDQKAR